MRKGITSIIAIIILVLITVGMAGAAWSYLSTYWTGLVSKNLEITDAFCTGTSTGNVYFRNTGTGTITYASDVSVINTTTGTTVTVTYDPLTSITSGARGKFTFTCATGSLCNLRVTVAGRSTPVSVQC